jgi:hypothetical protein
MFSTYARARGRGVMGAVLTHMAKMGKVFLTRRSKTSSLSSLSSPKEVFWLKDQGLGVSDFCPTIVPKAKHIVPIFPKETDQTQEAASGRNPSTKY